MNMPDLPLLIEPDVLENTLGYDNLLIVDLSKAETWRKLHIPGAVHVDYARITAARKPVMGLLPEVETLDALFTSTGIDEQTHVVAYDDEGGGRAARLLWTLDMAGHTRFSLLNGGLHAWANEGHSYTDEPVTPVTKQFHSRYNEQPSADSSYIKERLGNADTCLLDVRSPAEYSGMKKFAAQGGHIPGAVNIEWTQMMDQPRNLRFKPDDELFTLLESVGATPDKEVIVYCQTHHRSAHSYIVLKHLGFEKLKAYPGSWSDWGNNPDLPVES
jgi:thiosulfate/3-mercaptopyruvate sulfurtransferase